MKKKYLLILAAIFCLGKASYGQLVTGSNMFLQGAWLEIGMCPNGAFGGTNIPAGYHPHLGFGGGNLAECYDYGHDGWAVGTPPFMGDYTFPGSPFEGWTIQVNGQRAQGYYNGAGTFTFSGGGTMTGASHTSYINSGGSIIGNWAGTTNGGNLDMKMETRVDTFASWVVCTVKMYNKTSAPINGVYYWRSCDPDNDQTWPGGSFTTDNVIDYQNDALHRVSITATGRSATKPPLTLCTKDCRAVGVIYGSWGLTVGQDLAAVWNKTYGSPTGFPTAHYNVGVNHPGDIGIGIVFNVGTICANDSASISYAYVFNGVAGVDSAFPEPVLAINKKLAVTANDTFDACLYPTLDSIPLDVPFGDDKSWTWGKWTWAPSTALSATTGTHIFARINSIPGVITYTVTGVDSFGPGCNNNPCLMKTFYFTLKSCHDAWNNSPCYGDSLWLRMSGDSIGATYYWYGPKGYTSTLHNPFKYPALYSDTGVYYVVKTIGGVHDTDSTLVYIRTKPKLTVSSNSPLCAGMIDTLLLSATPLLPGQTFVWKGPAPNNLTSTLPFPTIPGFGPN